MIRLYPISSIKYTVFDDVRCLNFFKENGIEITNSIENADILIARDLKPSTVNLLTELKKKAKPTLIWTHEPRFCNHSQSIIEFENFPSLHIMCLYTRDVYFSNLSFYGKFITGLLESVQNVNFSEVPIVGLATYIQPNKHNFIVDGLDLDLTKRRQNILINGFENKMLHIHGKYWPKNFLANESRDLGWHGIKLGILENYQYNIAIENTAFDYYCTEKIWDSIKAYCLPIYSGFNNKIYEIFPRKSFIDIDEFENNDALFGFISSISKQEYLDRLNKCIDTYNLLYKTKDPWHEKQKSLDAILKKIKFIQFEYQQN